MNADEAFAVFLDERHHIGFLRVCQVQFASRTGKHQGIEVLQGLHVQSLRIGLRD